MKKILSAILCLALFCISLSGCSSPVPKQSDAKPETSVVSSKAPIETAQGSPATASDIKEFPLPFEGTVSSLNESLSANGYTELGAPKESSGDTAELGKHTAYTYDLGDGAAFVLYVSDITGNVQNFTVLTVASEITDEAMSYTSYLIGCLEGGLAGDDVETVDSELSMDFDDLSKDAFSTSSTSTADFMYMVQDGSIVFMVTPV